MIHNVIRAILRFASHEDALELLLERLRIPSAEEFDVGDQKQIDQWLSMSARHRGFHIYLKARDRKLAQKLVSMQVSTERERMVLSEMKGARMEALRLYNRANILKLRQEQEKKKRTT